MAGTAKKSGNPAKRAAAKKAAAAPPPVAPPRPEERATAATWKSNAGGGAEDVRLPSGNVALVKRVGPEAFLAQGMMPDTLTPIITQAINSKQGLPPSRLKKMAEQPADVAAMMEMVDRVTCAAVVQPPVAMPPVCVQCNQYFTSKDNVHRDPAVDGYHAYQEGERNPDVLYVDVVDLEDKIFILNFTVGGTRDLQRFRGELGSSVAHLSASEDVGDEAE